MRARLFSLTAVTVLALGVAGCSSPPVVRDNTAATTYEKPIDVDVIANATNIDGRTLKVVAITQPVNGSAAIKSDHTITYTPNAAFSGRDELEYVVSDGNKKEDRRAKLFIDVAPREVTAVVPVPVEVGGTHGEGEAGARME
ncbi:MAG: Ig-like domain-containing protein, partial [Polyangiaceae bacterium]